MLVWGTKGCVYGSEDEFESHDAQEICAHFFVGDGGKVCYHRVANAGFFLHLAISY